MNKKTRILFCPSDIAGVGHFRSIWPAQQIQKDFSDEFEVEINNNPNINNKEYFKSFDIIHFHRHLGPFETMPSFFKELRDSGVKLIMDVDDYWSPPKTHPLYGAAVKEKIAEKITKTFKHVDFVTTTTEIFAKHIKKYNPNVYIMVNSIDPNHRMWKKEKIESDKCRIAWIGGSSHLNDLELLETSLSKFHNDNSLKDKFQIVMCGYDTRGHITEMTPDGKVHRTRKIEPHETVWNKFEEIFTNKYSCINEEYKKWLKKHKKGKFLEGNEYDQPYVRRWTLPLTQYGKHYNYCDVCLAPLAENVFNEVKSELKIIEAGMMGKVLIAQDFGIYKELIDHGKTGLLVPKKRNHKDWYENMKLVINDKSLRETLASNLHNFVKDKYNIASATKDRVDIYKSILKK